MERIREIKKNSGKQANRKNIGGMGLHEVYHKVAKTF